MVDDIIDNIPPFGGILSMMIWCLWPIIAGVPGRTSVKSVEGGG